MTALVWTRDLPTTAGWWWCRWVDGRAAVVWVGVLGGGELHVMLPGMREPWTRPERINGREWAGPIPLPAEPEASR